MFVIVELLCGTPERRKRKRDWQSINNISGDALRNPLYIDLNINNKRQDCKISSVWGTLKGKGWMKEMKVRVYG
jgi:hypothetical protein